MNKVRLFASLISLAFLIATVILGWFATRFEIDASADTLLMKNNKHYIQTQLANQRYSPEEFILIAYKPGERSIFSTEVLERVDEISQKIEKIERVETVRNITNVPIFMGLNSFKVNIDQEALSWKKQRYSAQELKRFLSKHPLYEGLLINEAHTALSMQVVFKANAEIDNLQNKIVSIQELLLNNELSKEQEQELSDLKEEKERINKTLDQQRHEEIKKIRAIVKQYSSSGEFYLGGNNLLAFQLIQIIKNDLLVFGLVISLIVSILLYYLFRHLRWVLMPMAGCAMSVVMTLGILAVFGLKVTVISANVIALQIILTLAVIIHLIVRYQELLQKDANRSHQSLVISALKDKARPSFYAGLTTSIGFGSLIFSGVQPVISFGWMMVIAMVITLAVSLIFFPAALLAATNKTTPLTQHTLLARGMNACANVVLRQPKVVVITCLVVSVVGLVGSFRLTAENSFLDYFSDSTDVYRELSFIDKEFGGSTPFDILYTIPAEQKRPDLLLSASAIETIEAIQNTLAQKQAIGNITSLVDFTRIAHAVSGKPLTEYELTALYKGLDEGLRQDIFGAYFSEQGPQVRISSRIQDTTEGLNRSQLIEEIKYDLQALGIKEENYTLTNLFVLYEDILSRLVNSQFVTLGIVYIAMTLVLMLIFRSLRIALIALIPNAITTVAVLGAMGLIGIPLDLMTITITSVAMGISVDDTIHYIHRYQEESKISNADSDAITRTHLSVGYALVYTTMIIVIGFMALVFSDFVPSILFGVLTGLAMVVALLTDITLLPVMLKARFRDKSPKA